MNVTIERIVHFYTIVSLCILCETWGISDLDMKFAGGRAYRRGTREKR